MDDGRLMLELTQDDYLAVNNGLNWVVNGARERSGAVFVQHVGVERQVARELLDRVHALGVPQRCDVALLALTVTELDVVRRALGAARAGPLGMFEDDCHTLTGLTEAEFDAVRDATAYALRPLGDSG